MRSLKLTLMIALVILITSSPRTTARATISTFHVPVLRNPVTLDGVITGDEWADANQMDVIFERDGTTYDGKIYLKHDCTTLWMCIQVEDDDEESSPGPGVFGDLLGVVFDANGNLMTDAGDDMAILSHDDYPLDLAFADPPASPEEDDAIGGVNNVDGASEWHAEVYTFELSKPLNSGDSAGYDIAVSPGDEILTMFMYDDPGETPEAPPFVGFILSLEPCPVGGTIVQTNKMELLTPVLAYLTATVAIASTTTIIYRRRKKTKTVNNNHDQKLLN